MPRFVASIVIVASIVVGCGSAGAPPPSVVGANAAPGVVGAPARRPTFQLRITGGPDDGAYASDPTATLNYCFHSADGSWRMQYLGGQPVVSIDALVGSDAGQPGGGTHVATEIVFDDQTLKFDPSDMRGGDIKGRSTASVQVKADPTSATFGITATTPDRSSGDDGPPDQVDLTIVCAN